MRIGVGIFAKTIGHSGVKTRLAEGIGTKLAEEFYSLSVKSVEDVVANFSKAQDDEVSVYWAMPSGRSDISTMGLGLGAAMYKVANRILIDCDAYIIIGTDIPQISLSTLTTTVDCLKSTLKKMVFGPSMDGGFYLMAGTHVPSLELMESVQYSQGDTLEQLLKLLKADGAKYTLIEELSDVDIVDDLIILKNWLDDKLKNNSVLLESQKSILEWLIKRNLA